MYCLPAGLEFDFTKTKGLSLTVMKNWDAYACVKSRIYKITPLQAKIKNRFLRFAWDN